MEKFTCEKAGNDKINCHLETCLGCDIQLCFHEKSQCGLCNKFFCDKCTFVDFIIICNLCEKNNFRY